MAASEASGSCGNKRSHGADDEGEVSSRSHSKPNFSAVPPPPNLYQDGNLATLSKHESHDSPTSGAREPVLERVPDFDPLSPTSWPPKSGKRVVVHPSRGEEEDGVEEGGEVNKRLRTLAGSAIGVLCPRCGHENRPGAKYCDECGTCLVEGQAKAEEVLIQGFIYGPGGLRFAEDDWGGLRDAIRGRLNAVKEEDDDEEDLAIAAESDSLLGSIRTVENFAECVWCLQDSIRPKFKNGAPWLWLIDDIKKSMVDPLRDRRLILNVAMANIRHVGTRYYTFDHRRLHCMYRAGCKAIRVRIVFCGRTCNELFNKADNLGRDVTRLRVRGQR